MSCGVAVSYPGPLDGKWDLGLYGSVQAGGESVGFGKASIDVGYHKGSVSELAGEGVEIGGLWARGGASVELDANNDVSGGTVHYGGGYNASVTGSIGGTYSVVDGFKNGKK